MGNKKKIFVMCIWALIDEHVIKKRRRKKEVKQPFETPTKCLTYEIILFVLLVFHCRYSDKNVVRLWSSRVCVFVLDTQKKKKNKWKIQCERQREKNKRERNRRSTKVIRTENLCECQWSLTWTEETDTITFLNAFTYNHNS